MNELIKANIQDRIEARREEKRKLTTKEAAEFLRVTPRALSKWRQERSGPPYTRLGKRRVFYAQADLENFGNRVER